MTKVGIGFGDKTGSNCSKAVPIFDKQINGFTDPFEDTECIEVGLVLRTKLGIKLWQNLTVPILKKH